MAFGSRTVAEYDVGFNIDLGKVTGQLGTVGETFNRTTGQMSNDAIRMSVAQDKLTRAIARSGPESTAAKAALLNYRRELESLQHTQTQTVAATGRHTSALKQEERELSGAARGALAASGVFRGLGRAVAFSSSTFLGGAGLVFAIKEATKAAADQQTAEGQLETALKNRGIAVEGVRSRVDALIASNAKLGFGEHDTTQALTLAVTTTGSLAGATRLLSVAQNIARAKGVDLYTATQLGVKAFEGSSRALKALGVDVEKGAKGFQVLDAAQAKYAGRAVAYANGPTGAYARLNAELERTKVTIGRELLPAELRIADAVSDWLGKTKNQEKIQRDLNGIVKTGGAVVHDFGEAVGSVRTVLGPVNKLLGGTEHSVRLVAAALVALKVKAIAADMGILATNTKRAGASAAGAAGEYNALAAAEGRAANAGANVGRGGTGLPLGIPNVGGRPGVVGRINQYTGAGAGAAAASGLGLGILGSLALGGFGTQPDLFKVPRLYIDDQPSGGFVSALGKPPKPGSTMKINGREYLVTYKANGDAYLYSREYLEAHQPTKGSPGGGHGIKSGPVLNPGAASPFVPPPLSRAERVSLAVQTAQVAVARGDKGAQAELVAALKKQIDLDRDNEKLQERLVRNDVKNRKQHLAELQSLYADEQSSLDQITSIETENGRKASEAARKAAEARRKAREAGQRAHLGVLAHELGGIESGITRAQTAEGGARTVAQLEHQQQTEHRLRLRLVAFYEREARDTRLTAAQRSAAEKNAAKARSDLAQSVPDNKSASLSYAVSLAKDAVLKTTEGTKAYDKAEAAYKAALKREIAYYAAQAKRRDISLAARRKDLAAELGARKKLSGETKISTLSQADIRAEVSSAIGTLHDILSSESNVSSVTVLKQIRTHLLQSENHLRVIRNGQALSQAEDRSRPLINAHLARQASFA